MPKLLQALTKGMPMSFSSRLGSIVPLLAMGLNAMCVLAMVAELGVARYLAIVSGMTAYEGATGLSTFVEADCIVLVDACRACCVGYPWSNGFIDILSLRGELKNDLIAAEVRFSGDPGGTSVA